MRAASKKYFIFLWTFYLPRLLSLPSPPWTGIMDSLNSSFTIEVNGVAIANVGDNTEDRTQAKIGSEAAVFTLKDGRLQCGDWVLGRSKSEDRSFLPKQVLWFKTSADNERKVQPVTAHQDGELYKLKFANAGLIAEDGNIFADIQGGEQSSAIVKLKI